MAAAYASLSREMRDFLEGLFARHETGGALLDYVRENVPAERAKSALEEVGEGCRHPLVVTHPVSGIRSIYFEPNFVRRIEGLSPEESRFVCDFLAALPKRIGLQIRLGLSLIHI